MKFTNLTLRPIDHRPLDVVPDRSLKDDQIAVSPAMFEKLKLAVLESRIGAQDEKPPEKDVLNIPLKPPGETL